MRPTCAEKPLEDLKGFMRLRFFSITNAEKPREPRNLATRVCRCECEGNMASLEEEAKRVGPAIKNRHALMQRQWDGVPATAAAYGLKGHAALFNAVVKAVEKGCRGPGTLQALRRLKVDYEVDDGDGHTVTKTAMMSMMTHADPGYEGFMDAACEQAVGWLFEAQKAHAREKGIAAPAQVEFVRPAFWGRAGGTKAAFKTAVWAFLENALDSSLSSALQAEAVQAWKTHDAYMSQAEKKKKTGVEIL